MTIPMVDLRPMLAATEPAWRANLERLFERLQFILGEHVDAFERELAAAWDARFAVTVASGTAAIELGIRAAGLSGSGAEVVMPALTSPFTAQAILAAGCRPRFADVAPETLLLDAEDAETRVRQRTRALLPVHLYGQPCDLPRLAAVARRRGLVLLQDACQAHGAQEAGRPFTTFRPRWRTAFTPPRTCPAWAMAGRC
jgi:dTDP-4-amino-4,6-dideoxygalactose transaminase